MNVQGIESRWDARFSTPVQTGTGAQPAPFTMGTESFPGVNSGRGVILTPRPLVMPWSRKCRAIPLLPLWAVQPVQNLIACTMVHFTFTYTSTPSMGRTTCTKPHCLYNGAHYFFNLSCYLLSSRLLSKNLKFKIYRTIILPVVLNGCATWSLTLS